MHVYHIFDVSIVRNKEEQKKSLENEALGQTTSSASFYIITGGPVKLILSSTSIFDHYLRLWFSNLEFLPIWVMCPFK